MKQFLSPAFLGILLGFVFTTLLYNKLADLAVNNTQTVTAFPLADSTNRQAPKVTASAPDTTLPNYPVSIVTPENRRSNRAWWLVLVGLTCGTGLYFGVRELRINLQAEDPEETDPPFLESLFKAYTKDIGKSLPTPRAIKRFYSKVRLQYSLLSSSDEEKKDDGLAFQDKEDEALFFEIMLILETKPPMTGEYLDIALLRTSLIGLIRGTLTLDRCSALGVSFQNLHSEIKDRLEKPAFTSLLTNFARSIL